jgi:hypothetical protein
MTRIRMRRADVFLRLNNGKGIEQRPVRPVRPVSLYIKKEDSATRLTVMRRLGGRSRQVRGLTLTRGRTCRPRSWRLMAHTYVAHIEAAAGEEEEEGPAPKRKRMPGRRFPIGAEGPRALRVAGGLGASGPKKTQDQDQGRPDHWQWELVTFL